MNQIVTTGIVLSRINYGEADRIITVITPGHGKLTLMARGVRKVKSKLAGGIELFSVSSITFIKGKGDISTLVSTRLQTHFSNIITEYARTMIGYDILKFLSKTTQENCDEEHYHLLLRALTSLNNLDTTALLTKCWFMANLLQLLGHTPNTRDDIKGDSLSSDQKYIYDFQEMGFFAQSSGQYDQNHIKILRLLLTQEPQKLHIIANIEEFLPGIDQLLGGSLKQYQIT